MSPKQQPLYRVRVHVQDVHDRRLDAVEYVHAAHEVEAEQRALARIAARSLSIVHVLEIQIGTFIAG